MLSPLLLVLHIVCFLPYAFRGLAGKGPLPRALSAGLLAACWQKTLSASNLAAASRSALKLLSELENEVRARRLSQLT